MTLKHWLISILTAVFLIIATTLVTLYASGYRIDFKSRSLRGTGIISVSSVPAGALVYLNGVPSNATNTSIGGLKPGEYSLHLEKQGFAPWEKTVEVKKELVTTVKALLVPLVPELKPLTVTGVKNPVVSPDRQKIIWTDEEGIWLLDIAERPFDLTSRPSILLANEEGKNFSGARLEWGPDSQVFLIEESDERGYLYDLATHQLSVADMGAVRKEWLLQSQEIERKTLENLDEKTREKIKTLPEPVWSPDASKLLYSQEEGEKVIYKVYDLKPNVVERVNKPLPREYTALIVDKGKFVKVSWFSDSQHLVVLQKSSVDARVGTVSIVEIDGDNKTEVFTGTVVGTEVVATPNGSKLVVLTNFNPASQENNLYAIVLR